jgi:hypothetical protein
MSTFKIEILQLLMAKAGKHGVQYRRPYKTNGTGSAVGLITERLDTLQGHLQTISGGFLAGVAGDFVQPQAAPESSNGILIPNGWGVDRYYFFMKVKVYNRLGGSTTELIQGYTDHPDMLSYGGALDPNTRFTINSVTVMNDTVEYGQYAGHNVSHVTDAYHVVANNAWTDLSSLSDPLANNFVSMRPGDIHTTITTMGLGASDLVDTRQLSTRTPRASRRSNGLATEYASRIINSTIEAASAMPSTAASMELHTRAAGNSLEASLNRNAFINAISQINLNTMSDNFTLSDLFKLDPALADPMDQRMVVMQSGSAIAQGNPSYAGILNNSADCSESWGGATYEHQAAAIISNAIIGLLIEAGLAIAHVRCTNHSIGGPMINVLDGATLGGQDMQRAMFGFQSRLQTEVINQVSMNNTVGYNIEIRGEIARSTMINLQIDNRPGVMFVAPSFADALTAPVLAASSERLKEVAYDFGNMLEACISLPSPSLETLTGSGFDNV